MGVKEDREQLILELINRARLDPLGEAARYGLADLNSGLSPGTISAAPKQPLAYNPLLFDAAQGHNAWLASTDGFTHTGEGGTTSGQRIEDAGYGNVGAIYSGENLALTAASGNFDANAQTLQHHQNLFLSAGHRVNILNPNYEEVGISVIADPYQGMSGLITTQNFGGRTASPVFITGVNYADTDNNDFYSIGEGAAGRTVSVYSGNTLLGAATTALAGGYQYQVAANGGYEVVFSGGGLSGEMGAALSTAGINIKVDLTDGNTIETNVSATLTRDSANLTLLGIDNVDGTGNGLDNVIRGNKGGNILSGLDGNDSIFGGLGTDTAVFSGNLADYQITYNGATQTLTFTSVDGDVDTVTGVENFQFADVTRTAGQLPVVGGPPPASFSVAASTPSKAEGNSGFVTYTFVVTMSEASAAAASVAYTVAGSGLNPADLADFSGALSGTLAFTAGQTSKTVTVTVRGDVAAESDEGFSVTLSSPSAGMSLAVAAASAVIADDDTPTLVNGSAVSDILDGTSAPNQMLGLDGDDTLKGSAAADVLDGGDGIDTADYSASAAAVTVNLASNVNSGGDAQGDTLFFIENLLGSAFADKLSGDGLANILSGGAGNDVLSGGDGDDSFYAGAGSDRIDGGAGALDAVHYEDSLAAVTVDLARARGTGGDAQGDRFSNIEAVYGSVFNDTITGNASANRLYGNDGDDTLAGGLGADTLEGGAGSDAVSYLASRLAVTVNLASNANTGGDAEGDALAGIEQVIGSRFNDSLTGDAGANLLRGERGNDILNGGEGDDTLFGGAGSDIFLFDTATFGQDTIADFANGGDKLDFRPLGLGLADLTVTQEGTAAVLTLLSDPLQKITLLNFTAANLDVTDFL